MATLLRDWSYRYPWLYQAIARSTALLVGGDRRLRELPLQGLRIRPEDQILDLCCGRGEATRYLLNYAPAVTGLDASPRALQQARQEVPQATYVQGWAQTLPFADNTFDWVHTSLALHEFSAEGLTATLAESWRVLKPGGGFATIDFHRPQLWMWPGLASFLWLFETETAWQLIRRDLPECLVTAGFTDCQQRLVAGESLQVIQAHKRR